jgi:hypothetical protein
MFVPTKVDQSIAILKQLLATQLTLRLLVDCSRNRSLSIVGRPDSPMLLSIQEFCESVKQLIHAYGDGAGVGLLPSSNAARSIRR